VSVKRGLARPCSVGRLDRVASEEFLSVPRYRESDMISSGDGGRTGSGPPGHDDEREGAAQRCLESSEKGGCT